MKAWTSSAMHAAAGAPGFALHAQDAVTHDDDQEELIVQRLFLVEAEPTLPSDVKGYHVHEAIDNGLKIMGASGPLTANCKMPRHGRLRPLVQMPA